MFTSLLANVGVLSVWFSEVVCGSNSHELVTPSRTGGRSNQALGVPDMVIQRILRHANVTTMATYYIKTATDDVRKAMTTLEKRIEEASQIQSVKGDFE
jgi:hypothetical protein